MLRIKCNTAKLWLLLMNPNTVHLCTIGGISKCCNEGSSHGNKMCHLMNSRPVSKGPAKVN